MLSLDTSASSCALTLFALVSKTCMEVLRGVKFRIDLFHHMHACMNTGLSSDLRNIIIFRFKQAKDVYETQQNTKDGMFPFEILLGLNNKNANMNTMEVSNWQEIKKW